MRTRYLVWIFSAAIALGCTKEHEAPTASNPLDTGRIPPTPRIESVIVGNRTVTLTWTVDDTSAISKYNIFRSDSADADYHLVGSSSTRTYTDKGLVNGKKYFYKVASVDTSGLEGYKSEYVSAVPNIFSVTINGGAEFTNSRSVVLTFSVGTLPQAAGWWVEVSNDPSFEGATWEPLSTVKQWQLTPGDGEKVVYVKFQDSEGNESSPVSDKIILDTAAYIESFSFHAEGTVLKPGDVVHFTLKAGETGGRATVDIGNVKLGIPLRDDGTEGDSQPGDGIYEKDFVIEPGMEITDGTVTANFEDRVGNLALPVTALERITIREPSRPPEPVVLSTPVPVAGSPTSLSLSWSQSKEEDFASYRLFRSEEPGVDSTSTLVTAITDKAITSYQDTGLEEGKTYYYRIYVYDASGLCAGSNEVSGRTKENEPPEPVVLNIPVPVAGSSTSLSLSWSQSKEEDFASYRIFRSEEAGVDSTSTLVTTITDRNTTSYQDTGLEEGKTYYYRIYVYDASGLCSGSNEVSGKTKENEPPKPVVLNIPVPVAGSSTSLSLSWSQSKEEDFASYRLFRSEEPGVDSTSTLVTTITDKAITSYQDTGLEEGKTYYYRIYVYDASGLCSGSNEVSGKTKENEPPKPVVLNIPVPVAGSSTSLSLSWSQSKEEDFASYRLFRSEEPGVDSTSTLVTTITDKAITSYQDTGLEEGKTYYYRIYVYDASGLCSGSNEVSGKTKENEPPKPVVLNIPVPVAGSSTSLSLSWSQSKEEDFASYRIFRSEEAGVDSTSTLVTTITDRNTTSYQDTGLEEGKTYYYRIYVYDASGLCSGSNEVSGSTEPNQPPEPVTLSIPFNPTTSSLELSWTQSYEEDFAYYKVFRSKESTVSDTSTLVATVTSKTNTSYTDTGLEENTTYYYVVYVYDTEGLRTASNIVQARTEDEPPASVTLYPPSSISTTGMTITWSQSDATDFLAYRLYRSESPGVNTSDKLMATISSKEITFYDDKGLRENTTYYYRIYVYDRGGNFSRSNEVSATTENEEPSAVHLKPVTVLSDTSLRITWTESKEHDFSSYRIYRSTSLPVDLSSTLVRTLSDPEDTVYVDADLHENTKYYYRVYVLDTGGLSKGSNVQSATTMNGRPRPVTLSVARVDSNSVTLSWSRSTEGDFSYYKIFRSEGPGVTTSSTPIATIRSDAATSFKDSSVTSGKTYYYRIFVFDEGGLYSGSNEVTATIPE